VEFIGNGKGAAVVAWTNGTYEITRRGGTSQAFDLRKLAMPMNLSGPWRVSFQPQRGAPDKLTFTNLMDWSKYPDPSVKYFSGHATYTITFDVPADLCAPGNKIALDLGDVAVMAQVHLNGKDQGILWKAPYRLDVTEAIKPRENLLEIKVVNLWVNRLIGDEQLPEDSERNSNATVKEWPQWLLKGKPSPTGRFTFTSWKLWKKDSPLQKSGLLGPVQLLSGRVLNLSVPPSPAPAGN
jgi:hypothetical protein